MKTEYFSKEEFDTAITDLAKLIVERTKDKGYYSAVSGIPENGVVVAHALSQALLDVEGIYVPVMDIRSIESKGIMRKDILIVDDIIDSGSTMSLISPLHDVAVIHYNGRSDMHPTYFYKWKPDAYINYWWEKKDDIEDTVTRQIQYIGEDANREGLKDTPSRVRRSWDELYKGYSMNAEDFMTVFQEDSSDEIVLLRDIEMYSLCEHHMLPFFGKAHVAYLPDNKVIGISKLARLVEMYSRRLQIQERICQQITRDMDAYLQPKASACIIEAQHLCMMSRGVQKQNSIMTTSSLTGQFRSEPETRQELMNLIK